MNKKKQKEMKREMIINFWFIILSVLIVVAFGYSYVWETQYTYDDFEDSIVNSSLWNGTYTCGSGNCVPSRTESAGELISSCYYSNVPDNTCNDMTTNTTILPDYNSLYNLSLNSTLRHDGIGNGDCSNQKSSLIIWGTTLKNMGTEGINTASDNWYLERNYSTTNSFIVYQNGIWNRTLVPSGTEGIILSGSGDANGAGCALGYAMQKLAYVYYTLDNGSISINYPASSLSHNGYSYFTSRINFNISTNTTINQLKNLSLYIDNQINESVTISGLYNYTNFSRLFYTSLPSAVSRSISWYAYVCDTDNNCKRGDIYNFSLVHFIINSISYESIVQETTSQVFTLNTTISSTITASSANLVYNGTRYLSSKTTSGSNTLFINNISIPALPSASNSILPFYWEILISNTTTTQTSISNYSNQTVTPIAFTLCNATYPTEFVNFTIYNESSLTIINATFDATFEYGLGENLIKNVSFSLPLNRSFSFCANVNQTYYVNSRIALTSQGFDNKYYTLENKAYTNNVTLIPLYMTTTGEGRNVIIETKDEGLIPLEGYTIAVYRYYPSVGQYILISEDVTDIYGQISTTLIENTVKYQLKFYNSDGDLVKSTSDLTIACRSTICILPFIIKQPITIFTDLENLSSYVYSLTFDNSSNTFSASWNDNTGDSATHRLFVQRYLFNGTTIVCNQTSTSTSGSLSCNVGSSKASYQAQLFRQETGETEKRIAVLSKKVGDVAASIFKLDGLLWAFILLMTLIAVGSWNPSVGIGLYLFGFIILGVMGIVYISPALIIGELVIGALFIWALRN